ncbi:MAG TPA: hypothetical protein VGD31_09645, partial [Sphingobacteriaceae bacterium]
MRGDPIIPMVIRYNQCSWNCGDGQRKHQHDLKTLTIALLALLSELSMAQERNFTRLFQLSLAPALSTNGMNSEGFNNYISFNLTSGVSSETYLLEIGTFSNLNVLGTRGLQVAGIA